MKLTGYWHYQHDELMSFETESIANRNWSNLENMPAWQITTRERLLRPVRSPLPEAVVEAVDACDCVGVAVYEARNIMDNASMVYEWVGEALVSCNIKLEIEHDLTWNGRKLAWFKSLNNKARADYKEARGGLNKICSEYDAAKDVIKRTLLEHRAEIEALHAIECPDCPWDGNTIFPGWKDAVSTYTVGHNN